MVPADVVRPPQPDHDRRAELGARADPGRQRVHQQLAAAYQLTNDALAAAGYSAERVQPRRRLLPRRQRRLQRHRRVRRGARQPRLAQRHDGRAQLGARAGPQLRALPRALRGLHDARARRRRRRRRTLRPTTAPTPTTATRSTRWVPRATRRSTPPARRHTLGWLDAGRTATLPASGSVALVPYEQQSTRGARRVLRRQRHADLLVREPLRHRPRRVAAGRRHRRRAGARQRHARSRRPARLTGVARRRASSLDQSPADKTLERHRSSRTGRAGRVPKA